jgi:thymidylate synthase
MNNLDIQYQSLLRDILDNGTKKGDRTGTGTISVFGRQIRHNMRDGFPVLTTKKMAWKGVVTELLWFLRGDTNIKYLIDNGCHIWDGDAWKSYQNKAFLDGGMPTTKETFIERIRTDKEFENKWGDLGSIYGKQWRNWTYITKQKKEDIENIDELISGADLEREYGWYRTIDQISNLIHDLKTNPDSRRLMVNAWNVGELDQMILPPCHYGFQIYTKELSYKERYRIWFSNNYQTGFEYNDSEIIDFDDPYWSITPKRSISLMWNQRSVDVPLGLPFNIASYGLLLTILGRMVGMQPDQLIGNLGDTHIYSNQEEGVREQLNREPFDLPKLSISSKVYFDGNIDDMLKSCTKDDFALVGYVSHQTIKMPLSN